MRKISAFYYEKYCQELPKHPTRAFDRVFVEVGGPDSSVEKFDATYALYVATPGYLATLDLSQRGFAVFRSLIVVTTFTDQEIRKAIESILPRIEEYGINVD